LPLVGCPHHSLKAGQPVPLSTSWSGPRHRYDCTASRNDQLYHYYLGDPIEALMLHADGTTERVVVGPDLRVGQRVQLLIPSNTFHTARVIPEGFRGWFLGASTEWPGVEPADVEIGNVEALTKEYPDAAEDLRAFQQGRGD
jgi:hypothetical protein